MFRRPILLILFLLILAAGIGLLALGAFRLGDPHGGGTGAAE